MFKQFTICAILAASMLAPAASYGATRSAKGSTKSPLLTKTQAYQLNVKKFKHADKVFNTSITQPEKASTDNTISGYINSFSDKAANWSCKEDLPRNFVDGNGYTWERTKSKSSSSIPSEIRINSSTNIFPGAILFYDFDKRIKDIQSGKGSTSSDYTVCTAGRTPVTMTADFFGSYSQKVDASKSGEKTFLNSVLSDLKEETSLSADVQVYVREVKSTESFNASVGISANAFGSKLNAKFNTSTQAEKNMFFLELRQVYFSVEVDALPSGENVYMNFADGVTKKTIESQNTSKLPLAYVNRVNYGRIIYALIETEKSSKTTAASLEASYQEYFSADMKMKDSSAIENSTVKAVFFGDNVNQLSNITTLEGIKGQISSGIKLSKNMQPKAISFNIKFLRSNNDAGVSGSIPTWEERLIAVPQKEDLILKFENNSEYNTKWYVYYAVENGTINNEKVNKWTTQDWSEKSQKGKNQSGVKYQSYGDFDGAGACKKWKARGWTDRLNVGKDAKIIYIHCRYKKGCDGNWKGVDYLTTDVSKIEGMTIKFEDLKLKETITQSRK
ncbi:MAG: thiol-activated cytolysin family protein [Bacteroidales bacterium]|nr:thiol-activated cytolysin family protein [Candidatus Physcocola equi]